MGCFGRVSELIVDLSAVESLFLVRISFPLDFDLSPGTSVSSLNEETASPALVYNSDTAAKGRQGSSLPDRPEKGTSRMSPFSCSATWLGEEQDRGPCQFACSTGTML